MSTFVSLTSLTSRMATPPDTAPAGQGAAAARRMAVAGASTQSQGSTAIAALVARSLERHLGLQADTLTYERMARQAPTITIQTDAEPAADEAPDIEASDAEASTTADAESADLAMADEAAAADDEATETAVDGDEPAAVEASDDNTDVTEAPDSAPARSNAFVMTGNEMLLRILASDSGYDNRIVMSFDGFRTWTDLGTDNQDLQATTSVAMPQGTQVEFGIVNGEGTLLRAGDATLNEDGQVHARVDRAADGTLTIGFEDLSGGGDGDFDDARIEIVGAEPQSAASVAAEQPIADVAPEPPVESPDAAAADAESRSRHEMQATIGQTTLERNRQLLASLYNLLPSDGTDPGLTPPAVQEDQEAADAGVTATVATAA